MYSDKMKEAIKKIRKGLNKPNSDTTVTRKELIQLVEDGVLKNLSEPYKIYDVKVDRGVYHLPPVNEDGTIDDSAAPKNIDKPIPKDSKKLKEGNTPKANIPTESVATHSVSANGEEESASYIPSKMPEYIKWGNYRDIEKILKSRMFYPVFITGLSGNGKTLMVRQAAANVGRECIRVNITELTDEEDLIGGFRLSTDSSGGTYTSWEDGPVIKAMERGAVLLLDEIDLATHKIMCLQPILEGNPIYIKKINRLVRPAEGFTIMATANTKGRGSEDGTFIGTNILNEAFLDRFPVTIEQSYPTKATESKILSKHFTTLGIDDANFIDRLVTWADNIRSSYNNGLVDSVISTRRLVHIAKAFAIFGDKEKAIELNVSRFDDMVKETFLDLYKRYDGSLESKENTEENPDPYPV